MHGSVCQGYFTRVASFVLWFFLMQPFKEGTIADLNFIDFFRFTLRLYSFFIG